MTMIPIPDKMKYLPIDSIKGLPVPWFVHWIDGQPEWRAADASKREAARDKHLCWVCGNLIYEHSTFVVGPMCGLNRISSEPPCHRECALYSVQACPFLTRPRMDRRRKEGEAFEKDSCPTPGVMIARNPGCSCLWETKGWNIVADGAGGWLFDIGQALSVSWWSEGRAATRAEALTSIITGLRCLQLPDDPEVYEHLARSWVALDRLLPR